MLSKRSLPVAIVLVIAGFFIAFNSLGIGNPPDKYELIFQQVTDMLEAAHFSPKSVDDEFSKKIFTKYLEALDPDKNLFLANDIRDLKKYELTIDDELHGAPIRFFHAADQLYLKRVKEMQSSYRELMKDPFQFNTDEIIVLDPKKMDYPKNEAQRKEAWKKRLKFLTLERYADLLESRAQIKKTDTSFKTDQQLEKDARSKIEQVMTRNFERLVNKSKPEDRFNMLVKIVTETMDPHTTFFPPIEKRSFDEQMSGRFYGIGASLRNDESGAIRIATIVAGLPAWKSQQLTVGDQVLKVGQSNEEPTDLSGFETEEAVKLIRGKKGTEVRLTVKKADGSIKIVSMIRDEVILDETYARSAIINENGRKLGYIFLPEFYADWERPNGARCSQDVAREIIKLKEQKVEGIIMDLRNNGGGSLYDVVQMVGFFIPEGPVVQVKDREGNPTILRDRDRTVLYDGPLAVMVNEFSASASEIFAAAIQDYGRGVVIGSTSTYGKGTVQRNIGLEANSIFGNKDASELGTLKLTLQKFYRINGGSTQLKGVTPNIILPDQYETLEYREKDNPDALPWDEIPKAFFNKVSPGYDLSSVVRMSEARVAANPSFQAIVASSELMKKSNQRVYFLQLEKYKMEQKALRDSFKKIDEAAKFQRNLDVSIIPADIKKLEADNDKLERRKQWVGYLSKDIYIHETCQVISDMIRQTFLVKGV